MKLKTRERYSLRMMIAIAKLSSGESPIGLREVSRHCSVSLKYLEQLVGPLRNASLLRAVSGRGGGYTLARDPSDIRIIHIISAAVGPIELTECSVDSEACIHSEFCSCRALWGLINTKINRILTEYSLADLLEEDWPKRILKEQEKEDISIENTLL